MKYILSLVVSLTLAGAVNSATLDDVMARGNLECGISTGLVGFASPDANGEWEGFDVDYCRALAAALFGDSKAVNFTPVTTKQRFTALASGEFDILSRNTTWTFSRDTDLKQTFLGINYYDGQGFMVHADSGVSSATELDGASICIQTGTTTELNLADYFRVNGISYEPVPIETNAEAKEQFFAQACDAYTTDRSGLAATRASAPNPDDYVVLPEVISKEPLGPLVRHGDDQWADIGRWVLNALIVAEEKGITSANVREMASAPTNDPEINRLLGTEGEYASMVGLPNDWAVHAIEQVGNYSEIFERYIGVNTPVGLSRGVNALWTDGGLLYAPPFR
ncbi:MAG: amino acid ABC transporter substrate-binding protein [Rhodobacteraceae bacterium]|nr:amino acid ABC transporter substrate-binding protein [Paracoccaceae bacterium]